MKHSFRKLCVLAIDPASQGLGFVLLDGPNMLIDWGFHNTRRMRDVQATAFLRKLLSLYKPDVLVLEAFDLAKKAHRSPRILHLLNVFASLAAKSGVRPERIARKSVRTLFASTNKYEIALLLAKRFPEIEHIRPLQRKIWLPEDRRINIFDALALASTFFALRTNLTTRRKAA